MLKHSFIKIALTALVLSTSQAVMATDNSSSVQQTKSHDGLEKINSPIEGRLVYLKPKADFSQYQYIQILDTYVAFKKDWQKQYNKKNQGTYGKLTDDDIIKLKAKVAKMFHKTFVKQFNENGYPVVDTAKSHTLLIRPALVDLDLINPSTVPSTNSKTFTRDDESVTLYLELYDAVTGEILARVAENKYITENEVYGWQSRSRNNADMVRLFTSWATELREFLDDSHNNKAIKAK